MPGERQGGSFRDPDGFLFRESGTLYRQINESYREDYELLQSSGLYDELVKDGLLITHEEVPTHKRVEKSAYKVIKPEEIPFISYPYEWSFSQLKDAALLTLKIQQKALEKGMSLKDASAYNVQFLNGKPIFIDTLSFEICPPGKPWAAYKQFAQHFLAPLALAAYRDVRLFELLKHYIDGVPLDLAVKLLPLRAKLRPGLLFHLYLHAKSQSKYGDSNKKTDKTMSMNALRGIIDSLIRATKKLEWNPPNTEWGEYYDDTNYSDEAMLQKENIVERFVERANPDMLWDMGANTGRFSDIAANTAETVVAFDVDEVATERHYRSLRASTKSQITNNREQKAENREQVAGSRKQASNVLPLLQDLTSPSPDLGWRLQERDSLIERGPADTVMALALVHHLAIGNNVPLKDVAAFFAEITQEYLVVEFAPKADSQVKRLLSTREDIFPGYTQEGFETAFKTLFTIEETEKIADSKRILYLMRKTNDGANKNNSQEVD